MDTASRIRAARRERGMTQQQLADHAGVSRSTIALMELDASGRKLRATTARKIANGLEIPVDDLVADDNDAAEVQVTMPRNDLVELAARVCAELTGAPYLVAYGEVSQRIDQYLAR